MPLRKFNSLRNSAKPFGKLKLNYQCQHSKKVSESQVDRPVGRAVTGSSLVRKVRGSNLGSVKSDTMLPATRHHCDISSKEAVLPGRNDEEIGPANSLHVSAHYTEYNERFDLKVQGKTLLQK